MVLSAIAMPTNIVKRDGRIVSFTPDKIAYALERCFSSIEGGSGTPVETLVERVINIVSARSEASSQPPTVEAVQDTVEIVLQASCEFEAAKHYILYRNAHAQHRIPPVPPSIKDAFDSSAVYFPTPIQQFQFFDKYSRFDYLLGRRETWEETVLRTVSQLRNLTDGYGALPPGTFVRIEDSILNMRALPSMRMLAMAGPAFTRDNTTQYNCTYLPVDDIEAFIEGLVLTMAGCGVGYSVESRYVENLPRIHRQLVCPPIKHVVEDTTEGWATALRLGLYTWFNGEDIIFDTSLIRPAGTPLRIKGGRASGPQPLINLFEFARKRILSRQGSVLRPIDAHDIMCKVGSAAIAGGVRRMAMISLFDDNDHDMLTCKSGDFEHENNQRWNANNSMVWSTPPDQMDQTDFINRMMTMIQSGRGEPGIFSRYAAESMMPSRRLDRWRSETESIPIWGTNPCGEIVLPPNGVCNLTTVPARSTDSLESLLHKVETATIIGTLQSLGTHFPNLRPIWRENAERERLLGVSIGGQQDCPLLTGPDGPMVFKILRMRAIRTNRIYSTMLGINASSSITCVKPDGNSSVLLNAASGLHARWSPYYIRNVRVSATSPIASVLTDAGVSLSPENGDDALNPRTWVVSFPVASPAGSFTRNDRTAVQQCEYWLRNKVHWTEHNPSVTITYQPHEVIDLIQWVWNHRSYLGGMAFLPASDANYAQLPNIEIDKDQFDVLNEAFPAIDFSTLYRYESTDHTTAAQEVACLSGVCEVEVVPQP